MDGPREYLGGYEYAVIIGDEELWVAEAALEYLPMDGVPRWQNAQGFLRDLLITKLRFPLSDSLYSANASRTSFVPYQFRPVLKFLRNSDQRILIADEVGLGKTIEAAIIYLELKARLSISRVLVLCPSRLKTKWQDEMRTRFDEEFNDLDSSRMQNLLRDFDRYGGNISFRAIASFEMLRATHLLDKIVEAQIPLDLLIVDEAHHMRNENTSTYHLGEVLTNTADAAVFLTATPLHLASRNLYNLLHLLAPGEFNDPNTFELQLVPNQYVNRASRLLAAGHAREALNELRRVETTSVWERFLKNPYYHEMLNRLQSDVTDLRDRIALQLDLVELNTLSTHFTRTRKREVEHAAVRAAVTLCVELTPPERLFYDAIMDRVRQELGLSFRGAPSFAVIMKERQAASCLSAAREAVEEAARTRRAALLDLDRSWVDRLATDVDPQLTADTELLHLARAIGTTDSKFDHLDNALREALRSSPDSKVLIFSFFHRTLNYLHRQLRARGYEVDVISGKVPPATRHEIIERFRNRPEFRILLSSEVGAEGLDFQFCDILVNYDLPWNPMQVEQRIGRLDRFGQQHERIRIFNFYIADTIETRIFQRLYERIGIFERSIGDLEDILGEETQKLSKDALQPHITPDEQIKRTDEAARRIERVRLEEEMFENEKNELMGQDAIFNQQLDEMLNSGRMISQEEMLALIATFLDDAFNASLTPDTHDPCFTLTLRSNLVEHIRRFSDRPNSGRLGHRFAHALHDHGDVDITFSSEFARANPTVEFVTARHPLAQAAREYWVSKALPGIPATSVQLDGPASEAGYGYFFFYLLDVTGASENRILQPVIILDDRRRADETAVTFIHQLQRGTRPSHDADVNDDQFAQLERQAAAHIAALRDQREQEARRRNTALIAARKSSVRASFEAKIKRAEDLFSRSDNPRIRQMRAGQAKNLQARMEAKLTDLDSGLNVSVSSSLVAGGRVHIVDHTPS